MKIIVDNDEKKIFSMEKPGYTVNFTLLNMGEYVGHKSRECNEEVKPYWEIMQIDVKSDDPRRSINSKFYIDSTGSFLKLIISDSNGNTRVINSFGSYYNENDFRLWSKGVHFDNNELLMEEYYDNDLDRSKVYFYDKNSGIFFDDEGNVPPESILTNNNIVHLLRAAARSISQKFSSKENVGQIDDIEFEI